MKRYIRQGAALILAASMCFGLTACGNKGEKTNKTETKTLAQELGFGYLSEYHNLDLDLDWINSNNVSTAQGKLYFAGDYYNSDTGENRTMLYEADPATGTTKEIPTPALSNEDGVNEYVQQVSVCPDGSGYWMLINTYRYSTSADGTENAEAPVDDTAEATEDTAEAPVDDTAEAPIDDAAETAEDTAEAPAEEEVSAENAETAAEPDEILLRGRRATVCKGGAAVWQSERGIRVQDVLWCDIDHDGDKELMLLCWKRGRYGESRPFWVEEDEKSWSQHIYIYDWTEEGIRPIWMASDIGMDAERWRFDERERLVITERNGRESAWDWLTWGLSALGNPVRAG